MLTVLFSPSNINTIFFYKDFVLCRVPVLLNPLNSMQCLHHYRESTFPDNDMNEIFSNFRVNRIQYKTFWRQPVKATL